MAVFRGYVFVSGLCAVLLCGNVQAEHLLAQRSADMVEFHNNTMRYTGHVMCYGVLSHEDEGPQHLLVYGEAPANGLISRDFFVYRMTHLTDDFFLDNDKKPASHCDPLHHPSDRADIVLSVKMTVDGYRAVLSEKGVDKYSHHGLWRDVGH